MALNTFQNEKKSIFFYVYAFNSWGTLEGFSTSIW